MTLPKVSPKLLRPKRSNTLAKQLAKQRVRNEVLRLRHQLTSHRRRQKSLRSGLVGALAEIAEIPYEQAEIRQEKAANLEAQAVALRQAADRLEKRAKCL